MVHTLPLRTVSNDAERQARDRFERAISLASIELAARGDPILGFRAVGEEDRTLVWLLPPVELARPKIRTPYELVGLAIGLATQIADRHRRGLSTAVLSEHSITAHGRIAGAQVFAAGPWLADGVIPIRAAPEERESEGAALSGDVWRLGQLLSELARQFELPPEVGRMLDPDPHRRPTATETIDQLDAAFAGVIRRSASAIRRDEELLIESRWPGSR